MNLSTIECLGDAKNKCHYSKLFLVSLLVFLINIQDATWPKKNCVLTNQLPFLTTDALGNKPFIRFKRPRFRRSANSCISEIYIKENQYKRMGSGNCVHKLESWRCGSFLMQIYASLKLYAIALYLSTDWIKKECYSLRLGYIVQFNPQTAIFRIASQ